MKDFNIGFITTPFAALLTVTQTNAVLQSIQIVLTILCAIITIAFTVWRWYKKATEDGQITKDEISELIDDLEPSIKDINDIANDIKNGNDKLNN